MVQIFQMLTSIDFIIVYETLKCLFTIRAHFVCVKVAFRLYLSLY